MLIAMESVRLWPIAATVPVILEHCLNGPVVVSSVVRYFMKMGIVLYLMSR